MKRSLFIILGTLCFAIAGKAQGSDVSVQKKNTGYSILNDTVEAVKDSMTFEQRVEMINRMKLKRIPSCCAMWLVLRADFVMPMKTATWLS